MNVHPIEFFDDRTHKIKRDQCFIIMPFIMDWSDRVYAAIQQACLESGYKAVRADETSGRIILHDIWSKINESAIIVADLTASNPNVFYELGIAHALGRDVVPIAQAGETIPFDQTPFRTIFYQADDDGLKALSDSLKTFLNTPQILQSPIMMLKNSFAEEFNGWRQRRGQVFTARAESFEQAQLESVDLSSCILSECSFSAAVLSNASFEGARLIRTEFANAQLENAKLDGANISEASFKFANLEGASLRNTIALRVDFSGAKLSNTDLSGMTIDKATWTKYRNVFKAAKNRKSVIVEN